MGTIPESLPMEDFAQPKLGSRVAPPYPGHHSRSRKSVHNICHNRSSSLGSTCPYRTCTTPAGREAS
jgi:hypothetical protein